MGKGGRGPGGGSHRPERVGETIREVLAERLVRGLKTPGVGFCTITGVEVTPDMSHAKVFVSVYGSAAEREGTLKALNRASSYLRGEVSRALRMKVTPTLVFHYDESLDRAARVDAALKRALEEDRALAAQRGEGAPSDAQGDGHGKSTPAPDGQDGGGGKDRGRNAGARRGS
ncbi:MAG: 30S ribosome-binding factor RbfA [Myxococcota bacterium]